MATVVAALVGLFLASIIWRLARRQADRVPMFKQSDGPLTEWLPLWGLGLARTDSETERPANAGKQYSKSPWQPTLA